MMPCPCVRYPCQPLGFSKVPFMCRRGSMLCVGESFPQHRGRKNKHAARFHRVRLCVASLLQPVS
jgi:hypothetical protein